MLRLRDATPRDAAAIQSIYAPFVRDTSVSFESEVPSVADMQARVTRTLPRFPWLVVEEEGLVVGYAYAGGHRDRPAYRWSVETSVYLAPQARRRGLARRLYTVLFDLLEQQEFVTAYAGITLPNDASVAFHEAMGFAPIGVYPAVGFKQGRWHDVGWWFRALREPPSSPTPPALASHVRGTETWSRAVSRG